MNKVEALYQIIVAIKNVVSSIDNLSRVIKDNKPYSNVTVDFHKVIWLDSTGSHILIWYADGTGQILSVEGSVQTISAVGHHGKTCYKLTNGREMIFDTQYSRIVVE